MPFTRDGLWVLPTDKDIADFQSSLVESKERPVNLSQEMMQTLATAATAVPDTQFGKNQIDTYRAIGRLKGPADLVVPIYGGLHVLKECVDSILKRTDWPYHLYLVDDCSPDPAVREYLKTFADNKNITVILNKKNRGFPATVNRGSNAGSNPYIMVLNSDIIVTEGWLTKLLLALEADPRNQIVNPVTNNTAMINVDMYPGRSYLDMDLALNRNTKVNYPEIMPTGFCFGMRRENFKEIGPFDESYGAGYGEETQHWFRTVKAADEEGNVKGYRAVLADNCFIFHERGSSFSALGEATHLKNRRAGSERFHKLHPDFAEWQKGFDVDGAIGKLRTEIPQSAFERKYKGNVAWLVKSAAPCGGMNFIADIVNKLIEDGYNAKVCVLVDAVSAKTQGVTTTLHTAPLVFSTPATFVKDFGEHVFKEGKVFAAVTELTQAAQTLQDHYIGIKAYNHVQSWDVDLATMVNRTDLIPSIEAAYKAVPNIVSSEWVAKEITKLGGEIEFVTVPGVNPDLFHPRDREKGDERFTVGILLDSMYAYKGYKKGVEFLKRLRDRFDSHNREMRVIVIGASTVPECPWVVCHGPVSQSAMAQLMANEIDVFVDPAMIHSYGLPALEALVSGARAITFGNRGDEEYVHYFGDRLFINDSIEECAEWALHAHRQTPTPLVPSLIRQENIKQFVNNLFPKPESFKTRIEVVTPHLRKHGGPTTILTMANSLQDMGHNVSMSMNYTDWNPEVFNMAEVPLRTRWRKVPSDAKVVIINSDNPFAQEIMTLNPDKKYIMYKLSHNERFKQTENDNLNLPWDHIMTSTGWLRDACITPKESWTHKAWDPEKVTVVGWYHYGHPIFDCPPQNRTYGDASTGFRMGMLIHDHQLKGTNISVSVAEALRKKYEAAFHAVAFGETKARVPDYMQYFRSISRRDMAYAMKQIDVWFGASYTEGLGRMALEAMSAGAVVVTTDTGAEFLRHGENCLLYPIGEAQKGAELVNELVQSRDLIQKFAINGYKTAREVADAGPFKHKLNKIIKGVL